MNDDYNRLIHKPSVNDRVLQDDLNVTELGLTEKFTVKKEYDREKRLLDTDINQRIDRTIYESNKKQIEDTIAYTRNKVESFEQANVSYEPIPDDVLDGIIGGGE